MRSGTQLLCHIPGSHGKTFSKKNSILLLLLQAFSKPSLLRNLLKQDTALLSHVSVSVSKYVTGVTSQVFLDNLIV